MVTNYHIWGHFDVPRSPSITYFAELLIPKSLNPVACSMFWRHQFWRVVVSDQVGLIANAWMHYMYCLRKICRLYKVVSDGTATLGIEGLTQLFGNQQDGADCLSQMCIHDKIPWGCYPKRWRFVLWEWAAIHSMQARVIVIVPIMCRTILRLAQFYSVESMVTNSHEVFALFHKVNLLVARKSTSVVL